MPACHTLPVADNVRQVLADAQVTGTYLTLTTRLDSKDYQAVDKVLKALGGKWSRQHKAHVFDSCPDVEVRRVVDEGIVPAPARRREGFVATPDDLAARIIRDYTYLRNDGLNTTVLEPSAGNGHLVRAIVDAYGHADVVALEPATARMNAGGRKYVTVYETRVEDFLHDTRRPEAGFDLVVQNPPFALPGRPATWIDHVWHAWQLVKPGGRVVSVAPAGMGFREDRKHRELRAHVTEHGGWEPLPDKSFHDSGTDINTVLLWLDKPADWDPTPQRKRKGKPSDNEKTEKRAEVRELASDAADALDDEDYLYAMGQRTDRLPSDCRLATYSPRNQAMVFNQADALGVRVTGHLNTFRGWASQGRIVRAGSTALRIVAAMGSDDPEIDQDEDNNDSTEGGERRRFRVTTRFDWSQTDEMTTEDE